MFDPHLRERRMVSEWPGTQLIGHEAELRQYFVTPSLVAALAGAVDRLYAWQEPDFPEDLCLYRDDGSPWLATIAHESDAYLTLHDDELDEVLKKVPGLRIKKEHPDS